MPLINVRLIEGVFTPAQKTQIAERLTDAMVSVEGENMRGVTWCVIDEVKSGDWAIGGQCLTTEAGHALAAARRPSQRARRPRAPTETVWRTRPGGHSPPKSAAVTLLPAQRS